MLIRQSLMSWPDLFRPSPSCLMLPRQTHGIGMQTPREILTQLWTLAGGSQEALDAVTLTGEEPQLPSAFPGSAAAKSSVAAAGLAAAHLWKLRSGQSQQVAVDMRHAVVECRSERYLRVES